MEDTHMTVVLRHQAGDIGIFAVFDGHGGSDVSRIAPSLLFDLMNARLGESFGAEGGDGRDLGVLLSESVEALDEALLVGPHGAFRTLPLASLHPFSRTGSTSCIVALDPARGHIVVANTGDSRAILCLGHNGVAVALSVDHKPENKEEWMRIYRAGGFVNREGPCFRIDGGLNVSRALGDFCYKANRSLPMSEQKVVATPAVVVHPWELSADGFLIVACDGVFERMTRQDVTDVISRALACGKTPRQALHELLHTCCAKSAYELGQDNETAVLVQWSQAN